MKKKILWITQTAALLALLVVLQYLTKPMGQLVTGTCVNTVLAVAALFGGLGCGLTVALCSPVLAYLLGIAPQVLTVPAIMVGNCVYVVLLALIAGKKFEKNFKTVLRMLGAWLAAALGKFAALYSIVNWLICGLFAKDLLEAGIMKAPMLKMLPATFGWMQLVTALIGGGIALLIAPVLKKALQK